MVSVQKSEGASQINMIWRTKKRCTTPGYPSAFRAPTFRLPVSSLVEVCENVANIAPKNWGLRSQTNPHWIRNRTTASHQIASIRGSQVNFTPWFVNFLERGTRSPRRLVGFHWKIRISGFGQSDSQTLFFVGTKTVFPSFLICFILFHLEPGLVCFFPRCIPVPKVQKPRTIESEVTVKVLRIKTLKAVPKFLERIYRQKCPSTHVFFPTVHPFSTEMARLPRHFGQGTQKTSVATTVPKFTAKAYLLVKLHGIHGDSWRFMGTNGGWWRLINGD